MEIKFQDKVVLVTGSSRGIGKAIAYSFAESGAQVVMHYYSNEATAHKAFQKLPGSNHMLVKADLRQPPEIKKTFDEIIAKKARIDILVNNAGIFEEARWWELDYESWQQYWKRTIDTNLTGMANLTFLVSQAMIGQGGGKIINITSRGAFRGEPDALPYGSAKAGMNSFGQSLARALGAKKVYVYTLAPGWVRTDMTSDILDSDRGKAIEAQSPLNRVASPEEIANAVLLLAAPGTEYMTGCIVDMNGASYLRT